MQVRSTKVNKRRATEGPGAGAGPHPGVMLLVSEVPSHPLEAGSGHVASEGSEAEALWEEERALGHPQKRLQQ